MLQMLALRGARQARNSTSQNLQFWAGGAFYPDKARPEPRVEREDKTDLEPYKNFKSFPECHLVMMLEDGKR